jgi:hypothetical protein
VPGSARATSFRPTLPTRRRPPRTAAPEAECRRCASVATEPLPGSGSVPPVRPRTISAPTSTSGSSSVMLVGGGLSAGHFRFPGTYAVSVRPSATQSARTDFIVRRAWPRRHQRWAAPSACVAGRNATTRSIIEINGPTVLTSRRRLLPQEPRRGVPRQRRGPRAPKGRDGGRGRHGAATPTTSLPSSRTSRTVSSATWASAHSFPTLTMTARGGHPRRTSCLRHRTPTLATPETTTEMLRHNTLRARSERHRPVEPGRHAASFAGGPRARS